MKILSWNVNGIRAVLKKGFIDWIKDQNADIICIQETKAFQDQVDETEFRSLGYTCIWHEGSRPGYAGVMIMTKIQPKKITNNFPNNPEFHKDGRIIEVKFPEFTLFNMYIPNGGARANGQEMLTYKLNFYEEFINYVNQKRNTGEKIIMSGDFNICHTEIDIARPKENQNSIGFLPIEREMISKIIKQDYIDVFRHLFPEKTDSYTWWSYRAGARQNNVGWRIDYFMVSSDLKNNIKGIKHHTDTLGSDHCPLSLELNF